MFLTGHQEWDAFRFVLYGLLRKVLLIVYPFLSNNQMRFFLFCFSCLLRRRYGTRKDVGWVRGGERELRLFRGLDKKKLGFQSSHGGRARESSHTKNSINGSRQRRGKPNSAIACVHLPHRSPVRHKITPSLTLLYCAHTSSQETLTWSKEALSNDLPSGAQQRSLISCRWPSRHATWLKG